MNKLFLVCMLSFTIAQKDTRGDFDQDSWSNDGTTRSERRESMVIWRLTEDLDLSSEQAEKFFPRFRQHRAEMENLRRKQRSLAGSLKLNMKNEKLTSSEVSRIIKETSSLKRKMSDLEEKFIINSGDILNPVQQAKLGVFKHKMMKDLKGKMKNKRSEKGKRKFRNERKRNKRQFWN